MEHDGRKEEKDGGTRHHSELCSQCPVAGRHAVLNEAAAQTISSLHSVIGHIEVRTSLTTWPIWLILSYHNVHPHRSQTNRPHVCSESQSLMTQPQAKNLLPRLLLSPESYRKSSAIHRFNHILIWHDSEETGQVWTYGKTTNLKCDTSRGREESRDFDLFLRLLRIILLLFFCFSLLCTEQRYGALELSGSQNKCPQGWIKHCSIYLFVEEGYYMETE